MVALLQKMTGLDEETSKKAGFAFLYFFCILAGYYVLQPLRDEMGLLLGKKFLPRLFIWSMLIMLLANPIFSFLLNRMSRLRFVKGIYRFFALNLLLFIGALKFLESTGQMNRSGDANQVTGSAFGVAVVFFLWVGVVNLFATSVFWALMADMFDGNKGKKLFGFVGAGGTLGQMFGSFLTANLASSLGPTNLLFVTVLFLELAVQAMLRLTKGYEEPERIKGEKKPSALTGVSDILKSPFLIGICFYIFFYTFTSSFLWFQKQDIVDRVLSDRGLRVAFFAKVNLAVSVGTAVIQLFLTGRVLGFIGLAAGLSLVPVISVVGFVCLANFPALWPLAIFEVVRKTANYAISRPSREILYTAVSRREKYLSKSFIDTFVYRGGDAIASVAFEKITKITSSLWFVSMTAVPASIIWLLIGFGLGRAHARRMKKMEDSAPVRSVPDLE